MTSYRVSMLYDTSLEIGCPNNDVQFNKYKLKVCAQYLLEIV